MFQIGTVTRIEGSLGTVEFAPKVLALFYLRDGRIITNHPQSGKPTLTNEPLNRIPCVGDRLACFRPGNSQSVSGMVQKWTWADHYEQAQMLFRALQDDIFEMQLQATLEDAYAENFIERLRKKYPGRSFVKTASREQLDKFSERSRAVVGWVLYGHRSNEQKDALLESVAISCFEETRSTDSTT